MCWCQSSRGTKRKADYTQPRACFYKRIRKIANPSSLAKPDIFKGEQRSDDPLILNGRPCGAVGLPVALAHPLFGEFLDKVESGLTPEVEAVQAVLKLSSLLGDLDDESETSRSAPFAEALGEYLGWD